ncbi:uncharacterized protein B0H18DRAFT_1119914, partial [Fomitopsis serialis]|uniref:uncharacterized protein n=1 Tax=Fomitopsis serialis TaxID=139415 RepID=UPI00200758ED
MSRSPSSEARAVAFDAATALASSFPDRLYSLRLAALSTLVNLEMRIVCVARAEPPLSDDAPPDESSAWLSWAREVALAGAIFLANQEYALGQGHPRVEMRPETLVALGSLLTRLNEYAEVDSVYKRTLEVLVEDITTPALLVGTEARWASTYFK